MSAAPSTKRRSSFQLDDSVCSPQDLKAVINEIREYSRWYSHNAIMQRMHVTTSTKPAASAKHSKAPAEQPILTPAALALIDSHAVANQKDLDALITSLQTYEAKAKRISITLAAPPTAGLKRNLVAWCRQNIASDVLVTFSFNATLLGGMVVRSGSHIFDWSFRRQILAGKDTFPQHLHKIAEQRHV